MSRQFCLVFCLAVLAFAFTPSGKVIAQGDFVQRPLAPGVLKVVPPNIEIREGVVWPGPLEGLNAADYQAKTIPKTDTLKALLRNRTRFRNIWQLEFAYKPLRFITVDVPVSGGKAKRTRVWYLLYRVRNLNQHLSFDESNPGDPKPNILTPTDQLSANEMPCRFFPSMLLEGWIQQADGKFVLKSYRDKVLPEAIKVIKREEKITGNLYDGFRIAKSAVEPSVGDDGGRWGIATWADADPRINYAMVSVQGLTNAYKKDSQESGGKLQVKTLQLNFWRPGDASFQNSKFRCGIQYNDRLDRQILVCQRYRLPGPVLSVSKVNSETRTSVPLGQVSADFDPETRNSPAVAMLNKSELPENLNKMLVRRSVQNVDELTVDVEKPGARWTLSGPSSEEKYIVTVTPETWEVQEKRVRFVGPLDNFWRYRYIY